MKRRYSLKFNKSFGYSASWKKEDKQEVIDKLKKSCLDAIRNSIRHLSQLRDEQLLEILEELEWDDEE